MHDQKKLACLVVVNDEGTYFCHSYAQWIELYIAICWFEDLYQRLPIMLDDEEVLDRLWDDTWVRSTGECSWEDASLIYAELQRETSNHE